MNIIAFVTILFLSTSVSAQTNAEYEGNIRFYVWNSQSPTERVTTTVDKDAAEDGCDEAGNFAFIVHGWMEGVSTAWIPITVSNLLRYRTGCVYVIDYNKYSNVSNYNTLVPHFNGIATVLTKKVRKVGNFDRQYFFGFSFGSRLSTEVGKRIGNETIDRMDLCDPAGPGFDMYADPRPYAKNVGCINTSYDKGTYIYNCHQNYRMGYCGYSQAAAGSYPIGSHGLCPYMYNLAFRYDFVYNNYYGCSSARMLTNTTSAVKMGYRADFDRSTIRGDIFIATANYPPYVFTNGVLDNRFQSLLSHFETCDLA